MPLGAHTDPGGGPCGREASTTHEIQTEEDDTMYMSQLSSRGGRTGLRSGSPTEGLPRVARVPTWTGQWMSPPKELVCWRTERTGPGRVD
ncbi:hypothetical protein NDU88_010457 [Pleurodeles waltl]|uniref:Uncharacterized protein n=1 Tax=Pleurodeles waltl TaxID=8319 RepID=A0AAV7S1A9_PLEWA|nr:hypothetical protein NDU88_010457 [Pleurodeles waltl]